MFEQAKRELAEAAASDLCTADAAGLAAEMRELWEIELIAKAQRLRRLDPFERAEGYVSDGEITAAAWLRAELGLGHGAASAEVSVARVRRSCRLLAEAFDAGRTSFRHLQVAAAAMRRLAQPEVWQALDEEIAGWAQAKDAVEYAEMLDELVQQLLPEPKPKDEQQHEKRRLSVTAGFDGMVNLSGRLDPEVGEKLHAALSAASRPDAEDEVRTPGQRKADALEHVLDTTLDAALLPVDGGEKPHISLLVPLDDLARDVDAVTPEGAVTPEDAAGSGGSKGWVPFAEQQAQRIAAATAAAEAVDRRPRFAWTGPTGVATARRLSCDGILLPIFTRDGQPIDVGRRTRVVSAGLRSFVVARDRHCQWGTCQVSARWCQVHHVQHWRNGGVTSRHNLLLLCDKHHRAAHSGRFVVVLHGPGKITIRPRRGTEPLYEIRSPDPPPQQPSLTDQLTVAAAQLRAG